MHDMMIAFAFVAMVALPAIVASFSQKESDEDD
jgi:hypothetical protein